MKTQVFKSYSDFLRREDKETNGVSEEFAKENPDFEQQNSSNKACWNCRKCSSCSYCSYCSSCSDCSSCSGQRKIAHEKNLKSDEHKNMIIPKIENIHQSVLDAVSKPDAFDMSDWHSCDTKHCRAGWVVHLAGQPGYDLEKQTNTVFAALQIYKASSEIRVSPSKFYGSNELALQDIKRCAEEEQKLNAEKK